MENKLNPISPTSPQWAKGQYLEAKNLYHEALAEKPRSPYTIMLGKIQEARFEYYDSFKG